MMTTTTTSTTISTATVSTSRAVSSAGPLAPTSGPLNAAQAGSRPEPVEAQSLTVAPAAQYVTRSSSQVASPAAVASR